MLLTEEEVMNKQLYELILAIKRKCQSHEEEIRKELDLSQAEFNALLVLNPDEKIPGNTLAERMALSASRSSRVLTKLMQHGYVTSQFKPEDRRSVQIELTPSGVKTKMAILKRMEACDKKICAELNDAQVKKIKSSLELLIEALSPE